MSDVENNVGIDTNEATITSMEPLDWPCIGLLRLWSLNQRNQNAFSRGVTKPRFIIKDKSTSHTKESTDDDGPDNVVPSSEKQQEPMDTTMNETIVGTAQYSVPLPIHSTISPRT